MMGQSVGFGRYIVNGLTGPINVGASAIVPVPASVLAAKWKGFTLSSGTTNNNLWQARFRDSVGTILYRWLVATVGTQPRLMALRPMMIQDTVFDIEIFNSGGVNITQIAYFFHVG